MTNDPTNKAPEPKARVVSTEVATIDPVRSFAMSPALALWFDDRLFERAKVIAKYIADAEGFTPGHLIGKPASCFAVVVRALTWKLDPYAVAQSTYETPGRDGKPGKVGYEGRLCQAIMENSGRVEGGVRFEHFGPWEKVQGKFKIATSQKGHKYPSPDWTEEDEAGIGVVVRAKVRGETTERELKFLLRQAFPRNSTLWATDPMTQICYTAVRRFASVAAPGLLMGVPFDREEEGPLIDVTPGPVPPRPTPGQFEEKEEAPAAAAAPQGTERKAQDEAAEVPPEPWEVCDHVGEITRCATWAAAKDLFGQMLAFSAKVSAADLEQVWNNAGPFLARIREELGGRPADSFGEQYAALLAEAEARERKLQAETETEEKRKAEKEAAAAAKKAAAKKPAKAAPEPQSENPAPTASPESEPSKGSGGGFQLLPWQPQQAGAAPPSPLRGGGRWSHFIPWLVEEVRRMPRAMFADFVSEEHYGTEYNYLSIHFGEEAREIDGILHGKAS